MIRELELEPLALPGNGNDTGTAAQHAKWSGKFPVDGSICDAAEGFRLHSATNSLDFRLLEVVSHESKLMDMVKIIFLLPDKRADTCHLLRPRRKGGDAARSWSQACTCA